MPLDGSDDLFQSNEQQANHYTVVCLRFAALTAALMWLLNAFGFFIVDKRMMDAVMPVGIAMFLLPTLIEKAVVCNRSWVKYAFICCFMLGIAALSSVLTIHTVLAWSCPIVLSCHYYSPSTTRFTTLLSLLLMLISYYAGLFIGVWDSNVMREVFGPDGFEARRKIIAASLEAGDSIYLRGFSFYYLPRAAILILVHIISEMLSNRTHSLVEKQDRLVRDTERIRTELGIATEIQSSMLPAAFPAFPERDEFDIFASMAPAMEVGGDFYDFFMVSDHRLAFVIADVSGKGVPAALFMMIGKTLIKDHTGPEENPGDVFTTVNRLLGESNREGFFITAFEGILDLCTGELLYASAGHEPPFILHAGGSVSTLETPSGFVLAGMDDAQYATGSTRLFPGDRIFLFTDGVTEADCNDGSMYGRGRLEGILGTLGSSDPESVVRAVGVDVDAFTEGRAQFDDITMMCIEYRKRMGDERCPVSDFGMDA